MLVYAKQYNKVGDKYDTTFIPDVDINCSPPYEKGKIDSCWCRKIKSTSNKQECEEAIGMSLQAFKK